MADQQPNIDDYRAALERGFAEIEERLRLRPDDRTLRSASEDYPRMIAILDAMTDEERAAPFDVIDSFCIRRLAQSAGATDQEVIQLLFSYQNYCELIRREQWRKKRGQ